MYSLDLPVEGRYYYSINRRIRKRKSANNFSNNYLGVSLNSTLFAKAQYDGYDPDTRTYAKQKRSFQASGAFGQAVIVKWGIQRRIGLRGFIDFSIDWGFATAPAAGRKTAALLARQTGFTLLTGLGW